MANQSKQIIQKASAVFVNIQGTGLYAQIAKVEASYLLRQYPALYVTTLNGADAYIKPKVE